MEDLTLKEKLQLFRIAKKPRREIRLKLEVITNTLNLPEVSHAAPVNAFSNFKCCGEKQIKNFQVNRNPKDRKKTLYEFIEAVKQKGVSKNLTEGQSLFQNSLKSTQKVNSVSPAELRLKNEFHALESINKLYRGQLENGLKIEEVSSKAAKRSEQIVRGEDEKGRNVSTLL